MLNGMAGWGVADESWQYDNSADPMYDFTLDSPQDELFGINSEMHWDISEFGRPADEFVASPIKRNRTMAVLARQDQIHEQLLCSGPADVLAPPEAAVAMQDDPAPRDKTGKKKASRHLPAAQRKRVAPNGDGAGESVCLLGFKCLGVLLIVSSIVPLSHVRDLSSCTGLRAL